MDSGNPSRRGTDSVSAPVIASPTTAPHQPAPLITRHHLLYLAMAYGLSWSAWILVWFVAAPASGEQLLFNESLVWDGLFLGDASSSTIRWSVLAGLGVYGPLVAGLVATGLDPATSLADLGRRIARITVGRRWWRLVLLLLLLLNGPTFVVVWLTSDLVDDAPGPARVAIFLIVFFVWQLLTSGTEEVGWRGYLTEKLLPGRDFWQTGWLVGPVWALWHLPIVVMIFDQQGLEPAAMIGSLLGFAIGIVAMAILHTWFYQPTRSVALSIVIHAAFNTLPLAMAVLFDDNPAAVLANLLLWAVVVMLKRRHDRIPHPRL